jgi:hypothetical protein
METVVLSGGELGGMEVVWDSAEERMVFEGYQYRKVNGIAVYEGVAE